MSNPGRAPATEWTPERIAAVARNVTMVIVGGVLLGFFAVAANVYYLFLTVAVAGLVGLVAWQFEVALVIYALVAFVPWGQTPDLAVGGSGLGRGVFVSEIMLGLLLAIWFARYLFGALPRDRISTGFYLPLALYLAYCVLNVANSFIFWDPHVSTRYQHPQVNGIELGLRFLSAGALVMVATTVSSRRWLTWLTWSVMAVGFFSPLDSLLGGIIPVVGAYYPLLILLPACYLWAIVLDPKRLLAYRLLAAGAVGVFVFVSFVQCITWVSGWLGLFGALGAVTFIRSRRLFLVLLVAISILAVTGRAFLQENVIGWSQSEGDYDRFSLLSSAWKYAATFPLGVGLGNYRAYSSHYYAERWRSTSYSSAHGTYAQHLSETGLPGLALFLFILVSGFLWVLRQYRAAEPGPTRAFLLAALGQMVGIACAAAVGDYIIPTYHNGGVVTFSTTVYSWLIWGLAIAHVRLSAGEPRDPECAPGLGSGDSLPEKDHVYV